MLTALLIVVAVLAVLAMVGAVSMWLKGGCFLSWLIAFHMIQVGCEVLAGVVPAIVGGLTE